MLPNQTITIPKQKIALATTVALPALYDSLSQRIPLRPTRTATLAFATTDTPLPTPPLTPTAPPPTPSLGIMDDTKTKEDSRFRFATTTPITPSTTPVLLEATPATSTILSSNREVDDSGEQNPNRWPYVVLIILLLVCFGTIFLKPPQLSKP